MKVENVGVEMTPKYENVEANKKEVKAHSTEPVKEVKTVETNEKNVKEAVEKINKHLETSNTRIKFKIHDSDYSLNDKVSIKIIDEDSDKVIAEIPSEEAIELSEKLHKIIGFLFDSSK